MSSISESSKIKTNDLQQDFGDITELIGEDGKYHYFYKIYNIANNKFYCGIHSTDNINDNYLGSGVALHEAYKKYGLSCFVKHILAFFDNRKSLLQYEKDYVTEDLVNNPRCYNISLGGVGTSEHYDSPSTKGKVHINNGFKNKLVNPEEVNQYVENGWTLGQTHKSVLNKIIIHNSSNEELFIYPEELDQYIQNGWFKGGKSRNKGTESHAKGKVWINDGKSSKRVPLEEIQTYVDNGWTRGSIQRYTTGYIRITNGSEDKNIPPEDKETLDYFLSNGWVFGSHSKHTSKIWINKDNNSRTVDKKDLQKYLDNGWSKGRILEGNGEKIRGRICIHKDGILKYVYKKDLLKYIDDGWNKGNPKNLHNNHNAGLIRINNGVEKKSISPKDLQKYLNEGWVRGNLKDGCTKGRIRVNNGIEERFITKEEFQSYDKNVWKRGLIKGRKAK